MCCRKSLLELIKEHFCMQSYNFVRLPSRQVDALSTESSQYNAHFFFSFNNSITSHFLYNGTIHVEN